MRSVRSDLIVIGVLSLVLTSCATIPTPQEANDAVLVLRKYESWAWALGIALIWADLVLPVPQTAVIAALGIVYGTLLGGLLGSLGLITGKVVAECVFPLDKLPPSPDDVAVDVNGMRVNRDPTKMNGWDYTANNMAIQIHGPACEAIKNANAQVKITFG